MTISEDTDNYPIAPPPIIATLVADGRGDQAYGVLAGTALIIWGVVGMVLLALFFNGLAGPIADLNNMAASLETQRAAAVAAIDKAKSDHRPDRHRRARHGHQPGRCQGGHRPGLVDRE